MSSNEDVAFSLTLNVDQPVSELRKVESLLYNTLGLIRRMGLSESFDDQIMELQRLISVVNSLRLAYVALQAIRMAAGDPVAWAAAAITVATSAYTVYETIETESRG